MSVIKTNPSDKILYIPMEEGVATLSFNNTTFSHKTMAKKIAEAINNKKQIQLIGDKNENKSSELDIKQPVNNFPLQNIKELKGKIDMFTEVKNNLSIDTNTQVIEKSGILDIKGVESLMVDNVFTDNDVNNRMVINNPAAIIPKDIIYNKLGVNVTVATGELIDIENKGIIDGDVVMEYSETINKDIVDNKLGVNVTVATGELIDIENKGIIGGDVVMEYRQAIKQDIVDNKLGVNVTVAAGELKGIENKGITGGGVVMEYRQAIKKDNVDNKLGVNVTVAAGELKGIENKEIIGGDIAMEYRKAMKQDIVDNKLGVNVTVAAGELKGIENKEIIDGDVVMEYSETINQDIVDNKFEVNVTIADGELKDINNKVSDDDVVIEYSQNAKQNIINKDDIPLFSNMVSFPLQNIPQQEKSKSTLQGNIRHQLNEGVKHTAEPLFVELADEQRIKPMTTVQNEQAKPSPQVNKHVVQTSTQPVAKLKVSREPLKQETQINNQLNNPQQNSVKIDPLKNSSTLMGQQLATHHVNEKKSTEQGAKDSEAPSIKPSFSFAHSESLVPPSTRGETSVLADGKLTLLPEQFADHSANETPKSAISHQVVPAKERDLPSHVIAPVINDMVMRPVQLSQTLQPSRGEYNTTEIMENNPLLSESEQPKTAARTFTYTFNHWQSSPSVKFELSSKGEFLGSTPSQEVQLALNENKHLLNHENSVHIRREDERQQHRNRQQHDQQQEED